MDTIEFRMPDFREVAAIECEARRMRSRMIAGFAAAGWRRLGEVFARQNGASRQGVSA
jgi:hypothetical protein